jgi:hypothetical protein
MLQLAAAAAAATAAAAAAAMMCTVLFHCRSRVVTRTTIRSDNDVKA